MMDERVAPNLVNDFFFWYTPPLGPSLKSTLMNFMRNGLRNTFYLMDEVVPSVG